MSCYSQQVRAMDDDDETFGEVTFSLSEDDGDKPFEITTQPGGFGYIRTTQPLDFELVEGYTLTVVVEDVADTPNSNQTTINVTVININDNTPIFLENGAPVDTVPRRLLEETPFPFTLLVLQVCCSLFSVP